VSPRRLFLNGREEIVQRVRDDRVVIDGHEERRDHAGQPDACKKQKTERLIPFRIGRVYPETVRDDRDQRGGGTNKQRSKNNNTF